ncbi:MAG TPA: hypothetical protein PLA65_11630 [Spirochaetota bacterium]|nr:hypothetical protein [Spirochaetota bacterium]HOD14668.1 hypothetical protein [Spirochaetota bacterium]HPG49143.1 hypothetical protein [Spirochaetota bacterium]HPN12705.1 hypothetical protein [Spirochaetota bacterium]
MKVIHVIKKIEELDKDIQELKKLEKFVKKNKSFTTPIFMSIEKQINILLGDRIKLFDLKIENPPEILLKAIEGDEKDARPATAARPVQQQVEKKKKEPRAKKTVEEEPVDDDDIPMLTQDLIDARINTIKAEKEKPKPAAAKPVAEKKAVNDPGVKILDIALEKGTLSDDVDEGKDKDKKVKFFRDNFPVE